jgi:hypothetical protein
MSQGRGRLPGTWMEFGLDGGHGMAYGWEWNGGIGIGDRNRFVGKAKLKWDGVDGRNWDFMVCLCDWL